MPSPLTAVLLDGEGFSKFEMEADFEKVGRRALLLAGSRVVLSGEQPDLILLGIEDVTDADGPAHA